MQNVGEILHNQLLITSFAACFLAQAIKGVVGIAQEGRLDIRLVLGSGGMPSSHSALVTALATGVGKIQGWASFEFAIATVFAVIVMYDATGVRQAAGKQAKILNKMVDELFQEGHSISEERLKELLGHTPIQVLAGCALGIAVSMLIVR